MSGMDPQTSPYSKKTLTLRVDHSRLELLVAHDLFSSQVVDAGSRLLLRSLMTESPPARILDLGCGYGPLGLGLKAKFPNARLDMIDRDALAVQFASLNAAANNMSDVLVYRSLGYDEIEPDRTFDLVVSNIPGKAGPGVTRELLTGAAQFLTPDGKCAIVVVASLAEQVENTLDQAGADVLHRHGNKSHVIFHYAIDSPAERAPSTSFERGVYDRTQVLLSRAGVTWEATTTWGLPEFDSLGFQTELVIDVLVNAQLKGPRTLVINPGQGHVPAAIAVQCSPSFMSVAGRDLLALKTSAANLGRNGFPGNNLDLHHSPDFDNVDGRFDLVVAALPGKLPPAVTLETVRDCADRTVEGGTLILGGRSTTITRALESSDLGGFAVKERSRTHGFSAARLRK